MATRIDELAHFQFVTREHDQRKDGEAQLQAQNHLAEHEQIRRARLPVDARHDHRWDDRDAARDQTTQPRPQTDVEKSLHHDLAGQRAGQRRVLSGGEECEREKRARAGHAEHRRKEFVGVLDFGDIVAAPCVKRSPRTRSGSRR